MPTKATRRSGQKSSNVEGDACQHHQESGADQQASPRGALRIQADEEGEKRRAGKRGGREDSGLEGSVSELEQIDRQQQAHETVADRSQAARGEQEARFRLGAGGTIANRGCTPPLETRGITRSPP